MTLNTLDTASYQNELDVSKTNADAVIAKATQGLSYVNPVCNTHVSQAVGSGKKFGVYHFLEAGNAVSQADYFLKNISNYVGKGILALDVEKYQDKNKAWHMASVNDALTFLNRVYQKTGVRPIIYIGLSDENNMDWSPVVNANYAVWIAQYNSLTKIISGFQPRDLYGSLKHWKSMAMFQYTSVGRLAGYSGNLDFDVFYGDAKAWDAYAKPGTVVAQPATEVKTAEKPKTATGAIADVQAWLNKTYGTGLKVDNLNGPATKRGLAIGIQTEINKQFGGHIAVDGDFKSASKAAFKTIRQGASGNMTKLAQAALICDGYSVNGFDGKFGSGLLTAVKRFQGVNGLATDGVVGPATAYALFS